MIVDDDCSQALNMLKICSIDKEEYSKEVRDVEKKLEMVVSKTSDEKFIVINFNQGECIE
jgi:hypothetical protein